MKLSQFLVLAKALMPGVDVNGAITRNNTNLAAAILSANLDEGIATPLITAMDTAVSAVVVAAVTAKASELGITFVPEV